MRRNGRRFKSADGNLRGNRGGLTVRLPRSGANLAGNSGEVLTESDGPAKSASD